jgi:hypothetical protein
MSAAPLSGGCLCGKVRFLATPQKSEMHVCHCDMCRKWAGGALFVVLCGPNVEVADESALGVFSSSDWGERCFCTACGTTLFWRLKDKSHIAVAAASFDAPDFAFTEEIFIDKKPAAYTFANATHRLTGEEVFARFAAQQEQANG